MSEHNKVLEILHQVDLTAHQRLQNQELRDAVLDAEDSICLLEQQLRIRQLSSDCVAAIQTAQQRLARFEQEISFTHSTTRQDEEQYAKECGLLVDGKQFLSEETRLTSLRGIDVAKNRLARIEPASELSSYFVQGAAKVLEQAEIVALEHKLDTSPWAMIMDGALTAVAAHVKTNATALRPLDALNRRIAELKREAASELTEQHASIEAGNVAQSEEHVRTRMALLEGVSDVLHTKFKMLSQIESGPLVKAQTEAQRAQDQLSKAAMQVFGRFDAHLANLEADFERLEQHRGRATQNEAEARSAFAEQRSTSDRFLAHNLEKQTGCWREMLRLEAELSALAEQRREEVERRVRAYEREERRRCDMEHFIAFANGRQVQLRSAIDAIVTEKRVGAALADLVDKAVYTLSEEVSVMQQAVKETKRAALGEHARHFREQYLTAGELLFRKERLLEECDRKIVELRMQQEVAMDTLDPRARFISEQRSALEQQRDEVAKLVQLLKSKTEMYVDSYRPTDAAIRSTTGVLTSGGSGGGSGNNNGSSNGAGGGGGGGGGDDPIEELRRLNEERSRALDKYFSHMTIEASKHEEALGRAKPEGEWRVHPKILATQEEIAMEILENEATREVISQHRRKSLAQLRESPDTDPRLRAARRRSVQLLQQSSSARRRAAAGGAGDAGDPPATLLGLMEADRKARAGAAAGSLARSAGVSGRGEGDGLQLPRLMRGNDDASLLSSSAQQTQNKSGTINNSTSVGATAVGTSAAAIRQQQQRQRRLQQQTATLHRSPSRLGNNQDNSPNSHARSTVAEKLNAALRASALGLNESLEPFHGRALGDLSGLHHQSHSGDEQQTTADAFDGSASLHQHHSSSKLRRGIEPQDPHLFDELRLGNL